MSISTLAIEFVVISAIFVMSVDFVSRIYNRIDAVVYQLTIQPKVKQLDPYPDVAGRTTSDAPPVSGAKPVQIQFDSDLVQFESRPKFRSAGSAAIDYSKLTVRQLRDICKGDSRFAGYSPYVKKGKSALVEFMNSK